MDLRVKKVLFVFGTRPEAIKLLPLVRAVRQSSRTLEPRVCVTAQHREMLDQVLECFGERPDFDLNLMVPGQTLARITAAVLGALDPILRDGSFDLVVVQGDTTTAMAAAMAAFYRRIPVAHVEAGLRTGDVSQPFPEEMNRQVAARLASIHFAPTPSARANLLSEGIPAERIEVTGNTGIDALLYVAGELERGAVRATRRDGPDDGKKLIVVTAHRRENFATGIASICAALAELAGRGDTRIVYPVHRNPNVSEPVAELLSGVSNIELVEPMDYVSFVDLMRRCHLILTDSGGIQEEAPSLGKPVLVLRERTERPEAVEAGTVKIVGTCRERIVAEAASLLDDGEEYARMSRAHNPYGDGRASERILRRMERELTG
jgi:UDP-N-acetylglucosamine 2-epimerase (non-hydrolysing)